MGYGSEGVLWYLAIALLFGWPFLIVFAWFAGVGW
jgi:hypothetical protein